mgnify:CR=1 FL=1
MRREAKFRAIFDKYKPPGIRVRWKRSDKLAPAEARLSTASMLVPRLTSIEALGYAIHECAHYWLRHFGPHETDSVLLRDLYTGNERPTVAEQEYQAERWTQSILRLHGLPVTRELRADMKTYVAALVDDTTLKNKAPAHVKKWCQR